MSKRTATHIILIPLALLFGIIVIIAALIVPTVREVRSLRNDLAREQQQLEERYQEGLLLKRLRDDWEKIQIDLPLLDQALITKNESIAFITQLETLASTHTVSHRLTLETPSEERGELLRIPFTFSWEASWVTLLQTLTALEQEPYTLPIETIRVTGSTLQNAATPFSQTITTPEQARGVHFTASGTTLWKNE